MPVQIDPNVVKVKRVNAEQLKYIHDKLVGKVNAHNTDGLSHADIRQDIGTKIGEHNTNSLAHNDIRELIKGLTARLNGVLDSNDVNLDQLSEIVAYIKSNKTLIEQVTTNKVNVTDVVNNLTTNATDKPLSASMGVELKKLIDAISKQAPDVSGQIDTHDKSATSHADIRQDVTTLKENLNGLDSRKADAIVNVASGDTIVLTDSSNMNLVGLNIFGKSSQESIPNIESPTSIKNNGDNGIITLNIGNQSLAVPSKNGIAGLKVDADGTYIDSSGQKWISDEIDFAKRKRIQRIGRYKIDGTINYEVLKINEHGITTYSAGWLQNSVNNLNCLCSHFEFDEVTAIDAKKEGIYLVNESLFIRLRTGRFPTIPDLKDYFAKNQAVLLYQMKTPIESELTKEEIDAFSNIKTTYPNTTITNDCNAHMCVKYNSDTKKYLEQHKVVEAPNLSYSNEDVFNKTIINEFKITSADNDKTFDFHGATIKNLTLKSCIGCTIKNAKFSNKVMIIGNDTSPCRNNTFINCRFEGSDYAFLNSGKVWANCFSMCKFIGNGLGNMTNFSLKCNDTINMRDCYFYNYNVMFDSDAMDATGNIWVNGGWGDSIKIYVKSNASGNAHINFTGFDFETFDYLYYDNNDMAKMIVFSTNGCAGHCLSALMHHGKKTIINLYTQIEFANGLRLWSQTSGKKHWVNFKTMSNYYSPFAINSKKYPVNVTVPAMSTTCILNNEKIYIDEIHVKQNGIITLINGIEVECFFPDGTAKKFLDEENPVSIAFKNTTNNTISFVAEILTANCLDWIV